nr:dipeptidase [Lysinibacillus timonensis]
MKIVDLHCDILEKLSRYDNAQFLNDERLQANFERLRKGKVNVQVFAIFISPDIPKEQKFSEALNQIEIFKTRVLTTPGMVHITDWYQLKYLKKGEIGAVLGLEGCDCIGTSLEKLNLLLDAGVKVVGLTWNYENDLAYGALEEPSKGIKPFAKEVINLLNSRKIIVDLAHLNDKGINEVLKLANHLIASHCNSRTLCNHTRNLTDNQIMELVQRGGRIHVVFYPPFIVKDKENATIEQLIAHVKYLVNLVGARHVGFGSDFDGMDPLSVEKLKNASEYPNFINALRNHFSEDDIKLMSTDGFYNYVYTI